MKLYHGQPMTGYLLVTAKFRFSMECIAKGDLNYPEVLTVIEVLEYSHISGVSAFRGMVRNRSRGH